MHTNKSVKNVKFLGLSKNAILSLFYFYKINPNPNPNFRLDLTDILKIKIITFIAEKIVIQNHIHLNS